jgi:aromatic-amino-acid transaminase
VAFGEIASPTLDPFLALMARFRADTRPRKMDLGVGAYRDSRGNIPVFAAVKLAETHLAESQSTKAYLGSEGDLEFVTLLGAEAFGWTNVTGLQTVGGTGALRLAADLLAQTKPGRRLWMGVPSWPNHQPIFTASGLQIATVKLFDTTTQRYRPEALLDALQGAAPGDAVLLHGCCHNPTGVDPALSFWENVADIIVARGLVPLVDMAYQGLGSGWDEDSAGLRLLAERVPHLIVAYSCDKNFGLYRERVGALFIAGATTRETSLLFNHLIALARTNYSMPPDHGAAVVRIILQSDALTHAWRVELHGMRTRIQRLRAALAAHGRIGAVDLTSVAQGHGIFTMLPLSVAEIDLLQSEYGIYMVHSGRINIAGLAEEHIDRFVAALRAVQCRHAAQVGICFPANHLSDIRRFRGNVFE